MAVLSHANGDPNTPRYVTAFLVVQLTPAGPCVVVVVVVVVEMVVAVVDVVVMSHAENPIGHGAPTFTVTQMPEACTQLPSPIEQTFDPQATLAHWEYPLGHVLPSI